MFYRTRLYFLLACALWTVQLSAQNGPILPLDDPALWNLNALFARGHLSILDAGIFPVSESELVAGLSEIDSYEQVSGGLAQKMRQRLFSTEALQSGRFGIRLRPRLSVASQESNSFLRREPDHQSVVYTLIGYESWFRAGKWTGAWGWRQDRYYDRDPESLDTAHRWAIRAENAYLSYSGKYARILFGRVRQHWAPYGQPGVLLSDNPRPMDHLSFRLGTNRLNIRSSISELDSITGDGRFTGTAGDDSVSTGSERRYLAVHRLTIAKPGSWTLGLMHSILYSGPNSTLSLKFLNPFQVALHSVDEKPKNDENNGFVGVFAQVQRPDLLIQTQFTLDDLDILNGKEPASVAASLHIYRAAIRPSLDISAGATLVSSRTYNAEQPEGKYLYLGRGIATQYSDFVSVFLQANWFTTHSLNISPRVDFLFQGEADIKQAFPRNDEARSILSGTIEKTVRASLQLRGSFGNKLDVFANLGGNFIQNSGHDRGSRTQYFSGTLAIGYRFMWKGSF